MTNSMTMGAKATGQKVRDNWQTPLNILGLVDRFYGGQWFDPCPINPEFNGLTMKWHPRTYINPPFSEYLEWAKHGKLQPLEQIWICNHDHSTERFQLLTPGSTMCLLFDRVAFINPETREPVNGNSKCQTLIYRGNNSDYFEEVFQGVGTVVEVRR